MLQMRLYSLPTRAPDSVIANIAAAFNSLTLYSKHASVRPTLPFTFVRHATHAAQGRANGPKDSAGRRLGAKKTASEYVIPGNIIFRQRGTKWFPGENVSMGKDHTIYSTEYGYVRYYKNPDLHPKRRYIGVALDREGPRSRLPTPKNAPTRRRLGMYAAPIKGESDAEFLSKHLSANSKGNGHEEAGLAESTEIRPTTMAATISPLTSTLRKGTYWPTNYEIGKAGDRNKEKVRDFDRKDRWLAWRKRTKNIKTKMLARAAKGNRKTKGKKTNKGAGMAKR